MLTIHALAIAAALLLSGCSRNEDDNTAYAVADYDIKDTSDAYNSKTPAADGDAVEAAGAVTKISTKPSNEIVPEEVVEKSGGPIGNLDPSQAEEAIPIPHGRSQSRSRSQTPALPISSSSDDSGEFSCSTPKTCPMMRSCKEAYYHLNKCGDTARDQDGDGVPCEKIC